MFDTSSEREGAVTKLNKLRVTTMLVKDIDVALQTINRTFSIGVQLYPFMNDILELSSKIENVIKVLRCIPTKIQMIDFISRRLEAAKKAGIQETDPHFIAIKEVDTNGEKGEVVEKFKKIEEGFASEIKQQTLVLLDRLEEIKKELDPRIRSNLLEKVVPSMRLAAELFVFNKMNVGTEKEENISSEEMLSVLDRTRGKPQIVSTRKYNQESFVQYMQACITPSALEGASPGCDSVIKSVISKELGLVYLSTFFPKLSK